MTARPARCSSWVRQEKPSASTTTSCGAPRTAGSRAVSATATDTSWCPRSTPKLPARPQHPPTAVDRRAGPRQQRRVGRPAQSRRVGGSAVGPPPGPRSGRATRQPRSVRNSASVRLAPATVAARSGRSPEQVGGVAAEHGRAGRLETDDRDAAVAERPASAVALRRNCLRAPSSCPVLIQVRPQHTGGRDAYRKAGALEHADGRDAHVRREVVGERVDPEQHRIAVALGWSANHCRNVRVANRGGSRRAIDAGEALPDAGAGAAERGVDQARRLGREPGPPGQPAEAVVADGPRPAPVRLVAGPRPCTSPCRRRSGSRRRNPCRRGRGRATRAPRAPATRR